MPTIILSANSLEELPINVLFSIFSKLEFSDLKNVSETCWTLRVLANEKLMYHNFFNDPTGQYIWTKRYLLDSLRMLNQTQPGFSLASLHNTALFQSLRYLHGRMMRASENVLNLISCEEPVQVTEIQYDPNNDNKGKTNDFTTHSFNEGKEKCDPNSLSGCESECESDYQSETGSESESESESESCSDFSFTRNEHVNSARISSVDSVENEGVMERKPYKTNKADQHGLRYLQILGGFNKIMVANKNTADHQQYVEMTQHTPGFDKIHADEEQILGSPLESVFKAIPPMNDNDIINLDSPRSSKSYQSSQSTITQKISTPVPMLSNKLFSTIFQLEQPSEPSSDSDSSSSIDMIKKLQASKKVRDKTELFEKLSERTHKKLPSSAYRSRTMSNCSKSSSSPSRNTNKRIVSVDYLEELQRCNSPLQLKDFNSYIQDYNEENYTANSGGHSPTKSLKHSKAHHRRQLKASVLEGNRICYEKI